MKQNVSLAIILDERRKKKDNSYPLKLRVTCQRKRRYYGIHIMMNLERIDSLTKGEYSKVIGDRPRGKYKDIRLELDKVEKEAREIIDKMLVFNFDAFKKRFLDNLDYSDLFTSIKQQIKEYEQQGRPSTASSFHCTLKSWQGFNKRPRLPFTSINAKLLYEYETYMKAEGKSITTIAIYLRNIRRMFNLAIGSGEIKPEYYPFGEKDKGLYQIPESRNVKKALSKSEIKKIFDYKALEGSQEQFFRDIWILSYLSNGMNMADIFRLRYKNIQSDTIVFVRHKTAHNRKIRPVLVEKTPDINMIIERWGNKPSLPDSYVFNILSSGLSPADELAKIKDYTRRANRYIKKIAKAVGIEGNISTYSARHSFASVLKLSGENVSYISEALGHADLKTTENYLTSFDQEQRRKAAEKLTDW